MISGENLKELALRFEIDEFTTLREYLQVLLLRYLYGSKESEKLYFKGGTSIHFFLDSFRFSEDLDFTSLLDGRKLEKVIYTAEKKMGLEAPGAKIEQVEEKENSLNYRLKYEDRRFKFPLTIRLEFSLRELPLTRAVSLLETPFPVVPYPLVIHLSFEEVLAEKVRALLVRGRGRDLFDLWFLLSKKVRIRRDMVEKKMAWYGRPVVLQELISVVQGFDEKELRQDLGKFLPRRYRTSVIKDLKPLILEKLRDEKWE
jgi:predicted nucleotidyltransferase component of viral defense system